MYFRRQIDIFNTTIHAADGGRTSLVFAFQAYSSVDPWVFRFDLIGLRVGTVIECSIYSIVHYDLDIRLGQFDRLVINLNYECVGLDIAYRQL